MNEIKSVDEHELQEKMINTIKSEKCEHRNEGIK